MVSNRNELRSPGVFEVAMDVEKATSEVIPVLCVPDVLTTLGENSQLKRQVLGSAGVGFVRRFSVHTSA